MKLSCKILKTVFHLRCNTTVVVAASIVWQLVVYVIDKGFFFEAFLFKPRGGRSPPSGLNRKPRKILYLACSMAQAQINTCY